MADYSTVARPYAKAVFAIASAAGDLASWSSALSLAAQVAENESARSFLSRPELRAEQRAEFLISVCAESEGAELLGSTRGRNLLRLLAENDRLAALPEIAKQFEALKARAENKIKVTLTSATPVDDALASKVAASLERKLGRTVELELEVDEALLGGAIVRAEDMVIDGSVKSRLQQLTDALIN